MSSAFWRTGSQMMGMIAFPELRPSFDAPFQPHGTFATFLNTFPITSLAKEGSRKLARCLRTRMSLTWFIRP